MVASACPEATDQLVDRLLFMSYIVRTAMWFVGFLMTAAFISRTIQKPMLLHRNTRLLLLNHHIAVLVETVGYTCHYSYLIWLAIFDTDDCQQLAMPYGRCLLLSATPVIANIVVHISHPVILVERIVATWRVVSYESWSQNALVVALVAVNWLFSIVNLAVHVYDYDFGTNLPICSPNAFATARSRDRQVITSRILTVNDILSLILFFALLRWNRRLRRRAMQSRTSTLTERYQINENMRCLELMFMSTLFFCATHFVPIIVVGVVAAFPEAYSIALHYYNISVAIYPIFNPILLQRGEKHVRERRWYNVHGVKVCEDTELHFQQLQAFWSK